MYHLLSGFYNLITQMDEFNVLILGLDNAGKSTILEAVKRKFIKNYKEMRYIPPTIGLNLASIQIDNRVNLNFLDLGGQKELQQLWQSVSNIEMTYKMFTKMSNQYYRDVHGIIFVIDGTDQSRLDESKEAFNKVLNHKATNGLPLLILINKKDVLCRIEFEFKDQQLLGQREYLVMHVSGLKGDDIEEAIVWIRRAIVRHSLIKPSKAISEV